MRLIVVMIALIGTMTAGCFQVTAAAATAFDDDE